MSGREIIVKTLVVDIQQVVPGVRVALISQSKPDTLNAAMQSASQRAKSPRYQGRVWIENTNAHAHAGERQNR